MPLLSFEQLISRVYGLAARNPLPALVLVLSAVTHFMWLSYPQQAVFDEVHFGKFVNSYCCTGERFFDIHPPHVKLLIAASAWLAGYDGSVSFSHIGQPYGEVPIAALRLVPALAGTLLPLVLFILLRQLGAHDATAFLAAMAVTFDTALTTQNRLISLDGVLLVATFGALSLFLAGSKYFSYPFSRWWNPWFVGAGALAGLALGAKFTGLTALVLLGVLVGIRIGQAFFFRRRDVVLAWVRVGLMIVVSALVVYLTGWAFHFLLLDKPGSGDSWHVSQWTSPLPVSFVRETVAWHRIMLSANYTLGASHPDGSLWWSWPLIRTPVFYWQAAAADIVPGDTRVASIYFLGNPAVWWGASAVFVLVLGWLVYRFLNVSLRQLFFGYEWISLLGYFIAYVPLMRVPRVLFLYHYLTPLLFSILVVVLWLQHRGLVTAGSLREQPRSYFVALGVIVVLFLFFSPLAYGFFVEPSWHQKLFWLQSWR